jgi:hypothetical protein
LAITALILGFFRRNLNPQIFKGSINNHLSYKSRKSFGFLHFSLIFNLCEYSLF